MMSYIKRFKAKQSMYSFEGECFHSEEVDRKLMTNNFTEISSKWELRGMFLSARYMVYFNKQKYGIVIIQSKGNKMKEFILLGVISETIAMYNIFPASYRKYLKDGVTLQKAKELIKKELDIGSLQHRNYYKSFMNI